jgi:ribosomal protein L34
MHYPHKKSAVKRARMRTKKGRQTINNKRRAGRRVQVV